MVEELQEQLHAQEKELNKREGAIIVWEDGLATSDRDLGRVCIEHDTERTQTEAVR
jgi:hypothetical protein